MPKLSQQPLCRYCGGKIRKVTRTIYFGRLKRSDDRFSSTRTEIVKDRAEAQRLINEQIVSVRWWEDEKNGRHIDRITTWDGESYWDDLFCTGEHAQLYGRALAYAGDQGKHSLEMPDYREAVKARKED